MRTVTTNFKNTIKQLAVYSDGYVNLVNDNGTITFDRDSLVSIQIDGSAYRNEKVLGSIAQHSLTLELLGNQTANINLSVENRLQAFVGVLINSAYEYVQYQDFLVTEVSYTDTTNITRVYATDYLVKLNREFVDGNDYSSPITLIDYATSVLTYCGLSLENTSFFNSTFSIDSKPFEDYTSAKEIIERIAELALCFVMINKDNNTVEFKSAFDIPLSSDSLNKDQYFNLKLNDHNFGTNGINTLVLGLSQVTGENNTQENLANVAIDGAIEVRILDNPFINTEAKRISVLTNMFNEIDTFKYQPFTVDYRGFPYIEIGDLLVITKMDNSEIAVPVHETFLRYDGGLKGSLKAKSLNKVITSNKYISKTKQKLRNAEIKVDKVAGEITLISSEVSDLQSNYSALTIGVDKINSTIAQQQNDITTLSTSVNQTAENLTITISQLDELSTYYQHSIDGLTIGKEDSPAQIVIGYENVNEPFMSLTDGANNVAKIKSNNLYIANATIENSIIVGQHKISKYDLSGETVTIVQKI